MCDNADDDDDDEDDEIETQKPSLVAVQVSEGNNQSTHSLRSPCQPHTANTLIYKTLKELDHFLWEEIL